MENLEQVLMDDDLSSAFGYASFEKQAELLGAIERLPMPQRVVAMKKIMKPAAPAAPAAGGKLTGRDEAMKRLGALPKEIRDAIAAKRLQLVDARYYVVKSASQVSQVRLLKNDDTKAEGVSSISKAALDKDLYFLVTGIQLMSGVNADPKAATYAGIPDAIANGDFEFKANGGKYIVPKDFPCSVFANAHRTDVEKFLFQLENPKWIEPQTDITFDIRCAAATALNTNVKLVLVGAAVIPY